MFARKFNFVFTDREQQLNDQFENILKKKFSDDEKAKLYVEALQMLSPNVDTAKPGAEETLSQFEESSSVVVLSALAKYKDTAKNNNGIFTS